MSQPVTATPPLRPLTGWGGRPRSHAHVVRPESAAEIRLAPPHPRGAVARGLGRSYGDAAQNAGGLVYDMAGIAQIRAFDPATGILTADAGTSLDAILRATVPAGWFLPVTPGTRFITLGGAVAADVHGKNHHREGGFGRHVRSLRLKLPANEEITAGADDPVPDRAGIFAATRGGMGLTGIITEATLQLIPIETAFIAVDTERAEHLDDLMARMTARDAEYRYSVAWIDLLASGRALGRGVITRGDHAPRAALPARGTTRPLRYAPRTRLAVPPLVPASLLSRTTAALFNEFWFRRAPREERARPRSIDAFFYPLDAVAHWNRLYGPAGFLQYQFVVPRGEEGVFRTVVQRLAQARCPSFLAVLKRMGPGAGLLSFPIEGWTLALDIPTRVDGLAALLDGLDRLVADAGGRVYLAKDSRLRPEVFRAMYPELPRWQEIRARLDPEGAMRSDLARRLEIA